MCSPEACAAGAVMVRMWGHNRGNDVGLEGGDEKEGTWERKKE